MTQTQPKFKVGQVVLYENGGRYELGVVKRIVPQPYKRTIIGSKPIEFYDDLHYSYFVWYHMLKGDTTALTDEDLLTVISNEYAFTIVPRSVEDSIDDNPARQLSATILDAIDSHVQHKYSQSLFDNHGDNGEIVDQGLIGGCYYDLEDIVKNILNGGN